MYAMPIIIPRLLFQKHDSLVLVYKLILIDLSVYWKFAVWDKSPARIGAKVLENGVESFVDWRMGCDGLRGWFVVVQQDVVRLALLEPAGVGGEIENYLVV